MNKNTGKSTAKAQGYEWVAVATQSFNTRAEVRKANKRLRKLGWYPNAPFKLTKQ